MNVKMCLKFFFLLRNEKFSLTHFRFYVRRVKIAGLITRSQVSELNGKDEILYFLFGGETSEI